MILPILLLLLFGTSVGGSRLARVCELSMMLLCAAVVGWFFGRSLL